MSALTQVETKSETKVVEKLQGEENKAEEKKEEDAEHEELVRKSLNSLDLTSRFVEEDITNKTVQTKENLVAYAAIAYETVARAVTAEAYLKNQAVLLDDHLKTESYNLKTWIKNQYDAAKDRIKAEGRRIALLTDEVAELQHVYQDALAKEKSYQTQINQLSSERQLQRTPPLIPAVASAAMTDDQFTEAMQRLLSFDRAAVDVIRETSRAIAEKQRLISQGSAWIKNAEIVLQRWLATQNEIARKREQDGKKLVDTTKRRLRTVHNILEDATKFHAEYVHAIARYCFALLSMVFIWRFLETYTPLQNGPRGSNRGSEADHCFDSQDQVQQCLPAVEERCVHSRLGVGDFGL